MAKYDFYKQQVAQFDIEEQRRLGLEKIAEKLAQRKDLEIIDPEIARILKDLPPLS
jgi:hypothetical protein